VLRVMARRRLDRVRLFGLLLGACFCAFLRLGLRSCLDCRAHRVRRHMRVALRDADVSVTEIVANLFEAPSASPCS